MSQLHFIPAHPPVLCHQCGHPNRLDETRHTGRCYNCEVGEEIELRELAQGRKERGWQAAETRRTVAVAVLLVCVLGLVWAARSVGVWR